jgi:hypothetical protein
VNQLRAWLVKPGAKWFDIHPSFIPLPALPRVPDCGFTALRPLR